MGVGATSVAAQALSRYAGFPIPVFVNGAGLPCAWPDVGDRHARVLIVSPPKAGTYLAANLLTGLGFVSTGLHIMARHVSDYRFASLDTARNNPGSVSFDIPQTGLALDLVQPGQFIVSHLPGDDETERTCADFVKILPMREMRATFVSHMRFFADTARTTAGKPRWIALPDGPERTVLALQDFGAVHLEMCRAVLGWLGRPGVRTLRFEDLWGDNGQARQHAAVQEVARHAGAPVPVSVDIDALLSRVLKQKNKTWSGERTRLARWWCAEAEAIFRSLGGPELNARMGYGDEAP